MATPVKNQIKTTGGKPFWRSKKWWTMLIGVIVPVINKAAGLDLQPEIVVSIVALTITSIGVEGWIDAKH